MILGKRIRLRAVEERDLAELAAWINDPEISRLVGGFSFPVSMNQQRDWFEKTRAEGATQRWIVETTDGSETLGLTGLWRIDWVNRHALTALKLGGRDIRGKGYGTDAIMTVMSYAFFQLGLNRLWGEILPFNVASYKAYVEKCGWKVEGIFREHVFRDGRYHDQLRVAVLKSDFLALETAQAYLPEPDLPEVVIHQPHVGRKLG
jgi:RimJ/RimL family protein N-acetyltransferase